MYHDIHMYLSVICFILCRPKTDDSQDATVTERHAGQKSRPLYDVPYMFEAREFLRKKLIGKKVVLCGVCVRARVCMK